ncbi:MAG: molybdopterin converting factor subunit 1 [Saprospiraceae bacterium]|nr:molybdopterin converting factor subunit 1 [Saprospiraceae bacterium]
MIKVKCFGVAKEIVNTETLEMDVSIDSVEGLRKELHKNFPEFSSIKGFMVAVNQEYATDDQSLSSADEIAIIPPVSGG